MKPRKVTVAAAGASEFGGGILTATGIAEPFGPLVIAGTMVVASATHRKNGPLMQNGGFELPLTNLAVAVALLTAGSGRCTRPTTAEVVGSGSRLSAERHWPQPRCISS